jgi:hypothetical protein
MRVRGKPQRQAARSANVQRVLLDTVRLRAVRQRPGRGPVNPANWPLVCPLDFYEPEALGLTVEYVTPTLEEVVHADPPSRSIFARIGEWFGR